MTSADVSSKDMIRTLSMDLSKERIRRVNIEAHYMRLLEVEKNKSCEASLERDQSVLEMKALRTRLDQLETYVPTLETDRDKLAAQLGEAKAEISRLEHMVMETRGALKTASYERRRAEVMLQLYNDNAKSPQRDGSMMRTPLLEQENMTNNRIANAQQDKTTEHLIEIMERHKMRLHESQKKEFLDSKKRSRALVEACQSDMENCIDELDSLKSRVDLLDKEKKELSEERDSLIDLVLVMSKAVEEGDSRHRDALALWTGERFANFSEKS